MSIAVYPFLGDSNSAGWMDGGIAVSMNGVPGRLLNASFNKATQVTELYYNWGYPGATLRQYLDHGRSLVAADPGAIAGVFVCVWSPNMESGGAAASVDPTICAAHRVELQSFASHLDSLGILYLPTMMVATRLLNTAPLRAALVAHLNACKELWPYLLDLTPAVQDAAITDAPMTAAEHTTDNIHLRASALNLSSAYAEPRLAPAIAAAAAAQGITV